MSLRHMFFKEIVIRKYSCPGMGERSKVAGSTPNMTLEVLRIINETNGRPWEVLEPTPLTRQYLVNEGYIQ